MTDAANRTRLDPANDRIDLSQADPGMAPEILRRLKELGEAHFKLSRPNQAGRRIGLDQKPER